MSQFPFVGGSYESRSKTLDAQRTINLYPEMSESGPGPSKSVVALIGTPGLALWATLAGGRIRGVIRFSATLAIAVCGANVYSLTTAGTATLITNIAPGSNLVSMASNGTVVMLVDGTPTSYAITPASATGVPFSNGAVVGADRVDFIDGYFVFNKIDTGQFQITKLYSTAIDPLAFATAEGAPDKLLSLIVDHRELWLFGETSTEVWFNSGNVDFPFERIQGAFIEQGCAAKFSVAKMDNTVYWLTADDRGQGIVQRARGYQPQRISTHALEFAIASYARIDDAVAFTYQQEGHSFYMLSFPTANKTWVFDASTNLWHERAWRDPADGSLDRHRAQCHMAFAGANIVGDWENGNLYRLNLDTYTDNGAFIQRTRACSHLATDYKWQFFSALQIDMEPGVGIPSGQGSNPQAMLRWSDDGGFTWSNQMWAKIGKIGERRTRVRWRRLGKSRDRVFEVTISDPVKVAIIDASADVSAEP